MGYLGVAYDITARKQAEARLHQANQALERATRLKDEFLANMSHELRTPLNRKYEGTGLGLALVKHIVELHGGQVAVSSEVNRGSCFRVDLPYSFPASFPPMTAPRGMPHPCNEPDGEDGSPGGPLILLAEDNEANILTLCSYLDAKGYRLLQARNGQEAVDLATQESPHLILMDIQMPQMNGLEAIQTLRQIPHLAALPIIALTALAMEGDCDRCLAAGATDYLSKPLQLKTLVAKIEELLIKTEC